MSGAIFPTHAPNRLTISTSTRGRSLSCSNTSPGLPAAGALQSSTNPSHDQALQATPPSSRRASIVNALNCKTRAPHVRPHDHEGVQSTPIPISPAPPRVHSGCHQRSRSACLLPGGIAGFNVPGYARPTERSRSRSRVGSLSDDSLSTSSEVLTDNQGLSIVTQRGEGAASTFKITSNGNNPNALKIDSKAGFRLEVRILATNTIELVAVPIQVEPIPSSPLVFFTPPCSPSILDKDMSTPDLSKIPALNISAPAELDSNPPSSETENPEQAAPPPPQSAEEHLQAVTAFVKQRNISAFFQSGSKDAGGLLETLSSKAASLVKDLEQGKVDAAGNRSFITNAATVADVVKLSLYDQVIFCDDSYSMQMYDRVELLKQTLKSVAKIAIALNEPDHSGGISLRFMNSKNDGHMNNITSIPEIEKAISKVPFDGRTELGTQLKRKVLEPFLVDRLERQKRKLDKPILITIITDGKPEGEDRDELKHTILWCKQYMESMGYGTYAVGFHIAQVGDCPKARAFLREIQDDPEVREHVYVSKGVGEGSATSGSEWEKQNHLRWLNSLVRAIEH